MDAGRFVPKRLQYKGQMLHWFRGPGNKGEWVFWLVWGGGCGFFFPFRSILSICTESWAWPNVWHVSRSLNPDGSLTHLLPRRYREESPKTSALASTYKALKHCWNLESKLYISPLHNLTCTVSAAGLSQGECQERHHPAPRWCGGSLRVS